MLCVKQHYANGIVLVWRVVSASSAVCFVKEQNLIGDVGNVLVRRIDLCTACVHTAGV
jgi:hypothetical protein